MPSAASTPISRVRSNAAISIRLRIPMLAIASTIPPNALVAAILDSIAWRISGRNVCQVSTS